MTTPPPIGHVPDAAWFAATVSCRAACPVGTDAAGYVQAVADGRLTHAYDLARANNPLPSVCGRVCSAPCEKACRRAVIDAPVAIHALKRVACDASGTIERWHLAHGPVPGATLPSVGIVGAGPAGLAAAHDLRLAGHAVTLYDRDAVPGGMLLDGIPAFRLAREVVRREIDAILSLGIEFQGRTTVGTARALDALASRHAALLVAVGCSRGRVLTVPGGDLPGVRTAVDFLRDWNLGTLHELDGPVVVIGGGSVAFDAARAAQRVVQRASGVSALAAHHGAGPATTPAVVLLAPEAADALPVPPEERNEAALEGVAVRTSVGVRVIAGQGQVEAVVFAPVASLVDERGRVQPLLHEGRDESIVARTVIVAVGQVSDVSFLADASPAGATPWHGVEASPDGRTSQSGLYAAGDVSTGPGDLIDAIASGQRAAAAIIADLRGTPGTHSPAPTVTFQPVPVERRYWTGYDSISRRVLPVIAPASRVALAEVESTLELRFARREATRCLLCDAHVSLDASRCIACGLCVDVCPYGCIALEGMDSAADARAAVVWQPATARFALSLDEAACIRCGLCVDRCPPRALELVRA